MHSPKPDCLLAPVAHKKACNDRSLAQAEMGGRNLYTFMPLHLHMHHFFEVERGPREGKEGRSRGRERRRKEERNREGEREGKRKEKGEREGKRKERRERKKKKEKKKKGRKKKKKGRKRKGK